MSLVAEPSPVASEELLQPVFSARWALRPRHLAVCVWFAAFYAYLSYIPLFHSDLWGHVFYGQWILEHRALPVQDPVMPLAEGMPVVDNAWLAQVILALAERAGGAGLLSLLFALTVLGTHLLYTRVFFRLSGSLAVALASMALCFFLGFSRHAIIRPEIFGGLSFAALLWMLTRVEPWRSRLAEPFRPQRMHVDAMPRWLWAAVPLLFLAWVNLHGSFAVGLAVLACHAMGRAIDVAARERSLLAPLRDAWFRRLVLLTELAVAATLVNPYGLDLLLHTARFGENPNLRDVLEWFPLRLIDMEGIAFGVSIVVLLAALRHSRLRVSAVDVLLLLLLAAATAPAVRMIGWYAPVFAWVVTPHLAALAATWRRRRDGQEAAPGEAVARPARPNFAPTLVCGLVLWIAFALTPVSQPLLGGKPRTKEQLYSRHTPHGVTQYLREHPPQGLVFGPQWWGDWLAWDGPPGMRLFMTTNLHLAPHRVWSDYLHVARGFTAWEQTLDRYRVNVVVVHKELQPSLARKVRSAPPWRVVYEDPLALIVQRPE